MLTKMEANTVCEMRLPVEIPEMAMILNDDAHSLSLTVLKIAFCAL